MNIRLLIRLVPLLLLILVLPGCFAIPSAVNDERSLGTQYDDATIKTSIASAMLKENATKANGVNVHCFKGHVFLVGEADEAFRAFCFKTAGKTEGVTHVTPHWFPKGTGSALSDTALEAKVDGELLFAKNVSSTQVVVDVWGGHIVLTGIMADRSDIERAVNVVRRVDGVKSVTSYLVPDK